MTRARLTYSVVIPTKDRPARAVAAVEMMIGQTRRPEQIVVVDASAPPFQPPLTLIERAAGADVRLTVTRHEPSTSAQRNRGVDLVSSPIVLFLDDDVIVQPHYMEVMLRRWEGDGLEAFGGMLGSWTPQKQSRVGRLLRRAFMLRVHDPKGKRTTVRRSGKLRLVSRPPEDVTVRAVPSGAVAYRTDLVRKHRFDEHFEGYVLGEDFDLSMRISADAPILQTPELEGVHVGSTGPDSGSPLSWHHRGRREAYYRLRHLDGSRLSSAAFWLSIVAETAVAAAHSARHRDLSHVKGFLSGFLETLREVRAERLKPRWYYVASRAYQRAEVVRARRRPQPRPWRGVRILGYHRLTDDASDVLAIHPDEFRRQMETLLASDATLIRLDQALDLLQAPVEDRYLCITFDDGYHDNLEHGVPVLRELGIPATIFVPSAIIEGEARCQWYRRPPRFLSWEEISDLVDGLIDVQAHTRTHRLLPRLSERQARDEIVGSKGEIERHVPYSLTSLCYPAGRYGEREVQLLREAGFRAGVTSDPGVNHGWGDLGRLRRTMVYWREPASQFEAKVAGLLDRQSTLRSRLRRRRARA